MKIGKLLVFTAIFLAVGCGLKDNNKNRRHNLQTEKQNQNKNLSFKLVVPNDEDLKMPDIIVAPPKENKGLINIQCTQLVFANDDLTKSHKNKAQREVVPQIVAELFSRNLTKCEASENEEKCSASDNLVDSISFPLNCDKNELEMSISSEIADGSYELSASLINIHGRVKYQGTTGIFNVVGGTSESPVVLDMVKTSAEGGIPVYVVFNEELPPFYGCDIIDTSGEKEYPLELIDMCLPPEEPIPLPCEAVAVDENGQEKFADECMPLPPEQVLISPEEVTSDTITNLYIAQGGDFGRTTVNLDVAAKKVTIVDTSWNMNDPNAKEEVKEYEVALGKKQVEEALKVAISDYATYFEKKNDPNSEMTCTSGPGQWISIALADRAPGNESIDIMFNCDVENAMVNTVELLRSFIK